MSVRLWFLLFVVALSGAASACPTGPAMTTASILTPPVKGTPTRKFGLVRNPLLGHFRMHAGVDFNGPHGDPIVAAASGHVTDAAVNAAYGKHIVIEHGGGLSTVYAHLSAINVASGDCVAAGARIGARGNTGLSSAPHLHFEVRKDGFAVDPELLLHRKGQ